MPSSAVAGTGRWGQEVRPRLAGASGVTCDRPEFVIGYSDSTVVLHDELIGRRDGAAEVVWPILGRGNLK